MPLGWSSLPPVGGPSPWVLAWSGHATHPCSLEGLSRRLAGRPDALVRGRPEARARGARGAAAHAQGRACAPRAPGGPPPLPASVVAQLDDENASPYFARRGDDGLLMYPAAGRWLTRR